MIFLWNCLNFVNIIQFPILATIKSALWRTKRMKTRKIYYRFASMILAILCAFVSVPTDGLSGVFTVYAEETENVVPLAETEEEPTQEVDDVYFDAVNGVSYYYYGYSDGTAKIYNITFASGAVLDFPSVINTYTVTNITCTGVASNNSRVSVSAMTLPESITYIGESSFAYFDIGILYYNTNATNSGYVVGKIFAESTISNLVIGDNVEYIDTWTFDGAKFLFNELTLSVKHIGEHAFRGVWGESNQATLTLTDKVEQIDLNAFALNYFSTVNYDCGAKTNAWSSQQGIFYHSYISTLNFLENATHVGAYMFYGAYVSFNELTLSVPSIGEAAFGELWPEDKKCTLTLTENVTYMEDKAFMQNNFTTVNYNCNATTKEEYGMAGMFYHSAIDNLAIASTVTTIPNYTFNECYWNFDAFTIDVEYIGDYAFGHLWAEQDAGTLTLTERVNYICPTAFGSGNYAKINYNANADGESGYDMQSIFYKSTIGDLAIGTNVTKLPGWLFYGAYFEFDELLVNVETIGERAFGHAWDGKTAGKLTIGERVNYIYPAAFSYGNYAVINYKANADGESEYNTESIFYVSNIGDLIIDESVTKLPGWLFYCANFGCDEITVNVETIGEYAFGYLWNKTDAGTLTVGERVNMIYPSAFCNGNYKKVNYYANADGKAKYSSDAMFGSSKIAELVIGENVTKAPVYLFYNAGFTFQELTVNIADIKAGAFCKAWSSGTPAILTIGSGVVQMEEQAFGSIVIEELYYNSNSTTNVSSYGPFHLATIRNLYIDEDVEVFAKSLFYNSKIQDTDITLNAKEIDEYAFTAAWTSEYPVNLTIGEDVEVINIRAFANNYINHLQYNAKNAAPTTKANGYNSPFNTATITELSLGDTVERLNAYTFYNIKLTQEDLRVPNSVKYMGSNVFSNNSNFSITNLYIGSGLEEIKYDTFGQALTLSNVYVDALTGSDIYKATSLTTNTAKNYLPVAENVHIHTNSDFYYYFTSKATNVVSYCVDHMKESVGEEYLDEATAQYVTPTYNTCEICEYQTTAYAYEDAYTVDFYVDGMLYHTAFAKNGESVEAPAEPVKEGYDFTGWDAEFNNIKANMTVNAQFEIKTYSVTFKDYDGTVIETQTIVHGGTAFEPTEPTRDGYTFKSWDKDFSIITADTEVTATYDINYYNVTFVDYDGTILDTQSIAYGEGAIAPNEPVREGYIFKGWSQTFDTISEHTTVTAVYEIKKYTVTVQDYDGTVLETLTVEHGSSATPTEPVRESYTFIGWDKGLGNITENTTITALYEINTYTVIFKDHDGTILSTQTIEHGSSATAPEEPVREGYDFMGWSHSFDNITSDRTIEATYMIKIFSVIFKDLETIISEQQIAYGGSAIEPNAPTRAEEEWGQWIFKGWDAVWDFITGNTVINAIFDKVFNSYTVTFVDYDGTILDTQSIVHGENATLPTEPIREGYAFTGWDNSNENITGNRTITAQYQICYYTVTFVDFNGAVIDTQTVAYGSNATVPIEPVREGHTFREWSGTWENIKKDETVTAVYDINTYTVTFKDYDGSIIDTQSVSYGGNAVEPETPTREGYNFAGWDKAFTNITADTEIIATYTIKMFTVIFKDNTNIISTQQIAYGKDAVEPEMPTRPEEVWGMWVFKKWDNTWTNIKENTVINAVFDKKLNQYTVTFVDYDGSVLGTQTVFHGSSATAPTEPTREGYTFKQWDKDYSNVVENMTITAVYEINSYTVTFVDYDGSVIDTQSVKYQQSATLPETPTRDGYTFKAWRGTWENITNDSTVTATYDINIYKVDFVDFDGTLIDSQSVEHGKTATAPENPTRDGYTFKNWDKDYTNIVSELTITAVYEKNHVHEYTEEVERKDATCIEKGYVTSKCSCGDTETKELDVNPDNHRGDTEVRGKKEASCTENGYTGDTYCKSCDTKISDGTETDLAEHTPGEIVVENRIEPTTEEKGSYEEVIYCEICEKELSRNTVEIPIIDPEEPDEPEDSEDEEEDTEDDDSEEDDSEEEDAEEDDSEEDDSEEDDDSEEEDEEDSEEESETPIETESEETEEPEPTETETPVIPTELEEEEEPQIEDVVIPIAATAGVAGSTGTVYFVYWRRRRKILGNVLDENGNPVANAKVYIEGSDVKETVTNENGYFEFKNLKVGLYKFMLCNDLDVLMMEAEIYTEEKDIENAITTLESKCEVEAERIGKNISLILTIK